MILFDIKKQMSGDRADRRDLGDGNINKDDLPLQYMDAKISQNRPDDQAHEKW
jgi:hypothetical protein